MAGKYRSTPAEMEVFRRAVWDLTYRYQPLTLRQLYYRAVVTGLVTKDEGRSRASESRVGNAVNYMRERYVDLLPAIREVERRRGQPVPVAAYRQLLVMPFDWLTDNTRTRYQADQYNNAEQAMREAHRLYRRNLWRAQPYHVEVWCESDALADVLIDTTDRYGVALLPCRGQAGKRFVFDSAQTYARIDKPVIVFYIGDFDPSGLDIRRSLEDRMWRYGAPDVDFRWLAITPEQVRDQRLPNHGLNTNIAAPVLERFYAECDRAGIEREAVEAEAMEPAALRDILDDEIQSLIDQRAWNVELAVEEEEKRNWPLPAGEDEGDDSPHME
jgi:hypothetical protein